MKIKYDYSMSFSAICSHPQTERIDKNFSRCLRCGQSFVNPTKTMRNKTSQDFTNEYSRSMRNFDRNFSNQLDETYKPKQPQSLNEYYVDKTGVNKIIVDRNILFNSDPPKYRVNINGQISTLMNQDILQILSDTGAFRIDRDTFNSLK